MSLTKTEEEEERKEKNQNVSSQKKNNVKQNNNNNNSNTQHTEPTRQSVYQSSAVVFVADDDFRVVGVAVTFRKAVICGIVDTAFYVSSTNSRLPLSCDSDDDGTRLD